VSTTAREKIRYLAVATALAAMVLTGLVVNPASPAAAEPVIPAPDGLTQATAAASCWEIKQLNPSAPSGLYWLATPALGAADQYYCDQVTSGGGWVLIGRGREGWSQSNLGFGTSAQVRDPITGQAAFSPRQLSSTTIEGLLNGANVSSLTDGVRLRRALNAAGSSWQEATFKISSPRAGWTWAFESQQRVGSFTIADVNGTGGTTESFGSDSSYGRVRTTTGSVEGWMNGFGYGSSVVGSSTADSYLWSKDSSSGGARPFTQAYLRPKLLSGDIYSAIPSGGTAAKTLEPVADSFALQTVWGVAGLGAGPSSNLEGSNEVSAFTEAGGNVYVGGNFLRVQKTSSGGSQQAQSYLAAFNRDTGEFISTFRPTFDNQIKALATLPNNRIAAGGYFTQVNGTPRTGLVVLNATTGAIDEAFTGKLLNYLTGEVTRVRGLDVQDGWLYASGSFTHSTGGRVTSELYTRSAARFSVTDGTPDSWNPELNGTSVSVDASDRGDRTYFSGYFTTARGVAAPKAAAIDTTTAQPLAWTPQYNNTTANYQQAVKEAGQRVWLGGAQHTLYSYDRTSFGLQSTNVTLRGGDFQALATDGDTIYGGCHCFHANYSGASTWPSVGTSWTSMDEINAVGAWNTKTGAYKRQFSPILNLRTGAGAWALFVDSSGKLWSGGDFSGSTRAGFVKQWSGGFVRFGQTDASAPTRPSNPVAKASSTGEVTVSWSGSTDNRAGVSYQILRNDRVVAATNTLSVTLPPAPSNTQYFVRAVDAAGNWSASTSAFAASGSTPTEPPPTDPQDGTLKAAGSTWNYWFNTSDPTSGWQKAGYNASGWSSGLAPIGWGQSSLGTTLTTTATTKPLASFYRSSVNVADASKVESVKITTRADDGIVVYVNGTEVLRKNITAGNVVTGSTYANVAVGASTAVANPIEVTVPGTLFVTGENVISASVHSNYRSTSSHSFEMSVTKQ
jgi:hypothetical protein